MDRDSVSPVLEALGMSSAAEERFDEEAVAALAAELDRSPEQTSSVGRYDDVLQLFDMSEPADAAVAGHSPISDQLGVVDRRLEAWFEPFGGTAPTGYRADRP